VNETKMHEDVYKYKRMREKNLCSLQLIVLSCYGLLEDYIQRKDAIFALK
jgi:hypothetical protein